MPIKPELPPFVKGPVLGTRGYVFCSRKVLILRTRKEKPQPSGLPALRPPPLRAVVRAAVTQTP